MKPEEIIDSLKNHCNRLIELNKESIELQKKMSGGGIAEYLNGNKSAYQCVIDFIETRENS